MHPTETVLEVDRHHLRTVRVVQAPLASLQPGQARLRVDSFALTSNNITYGVFGDGLKYWDFFPAAPADEGTDTVWGRIPVWGFAEVVESTVGQVAVGTRVYGYLPMATEFVVQPGRFDERGFSDTAAHRSGLAGAYNRYVDVSVDPIHDAAHEAHQAVLWPLFFTSFVIDDYLDDVLFSAGRLTGSGCVVISSASSKTAIGLAFLLAQRAGVHVVGLTSPANAEFVAGLGCYHQVLTYDALQGLPGGEAAYVDIAGDPAVTHAVHTHFADGLLRSLIVGGTHWEGGAGASGPLPGPAPEFFFAPAQIAKRTHEWGRATLELRTVQAWQAYREWVGGWLRIVPSNGPAAVEHTYRELLDGRIDVTVGHICTMASA